MIKSFNIPDVKGFETSYYLTIEEDKYKARVFPPHSHDVLEIYFHIEGDASFVVEKEVYALSPCDCIISRPNEVHNCVLHSTSFHKHGCMWINSPSGFGVSDFLSDNYNGKNLLSPTPEEKEKLLALLYELDNAKDNFASFVITLNILEILRSCTNTAKNTLCVPEALKNILEYINENFKKIQSVEEILPKYHVSKSTLLRLFKKYINTTPKTYLESKKLAFSRILLKRGESVETACYNSGFTDCSNYIRLFKKRFNITPGKYRAKDVTIF